MVNKIVNNSGKILAFFVNIFIIAVSVLGVKIQNDKKELAQLKENINVDQTVSDLVQAQNQIADNREKTLNKVANAPKQVVNQTETTSIIISGKVVPITKTITTSGEVTKKSSSIKTTKSS